MVDVKGGQSLGPDPLSDPEASCQRLLHFTDCGAFV